MPMPAWVARLAREGSVPRSQIASESEEILFQLKTLGLAAEEVRGGRRRVIARDPARLSSWVTATYPPPEEVPGAGLRAGNIARARRSKAGLSTHGVQPLLLRWFEPGAGSALAELTRRLGLVGLTTDRATLLQPTSPWTLLTVENWETFMGAAYEQSRTTIVVVYMGGNIADATLRALASIQPAPQHAIHFGDYDWAGLGIYRRMRKTINGLELYVPKDIDALFRRFAEPTLLLGQVPLIPQGDDTPETRQIISLIAQHNGGVEQEIVTLPQLS